MGFVTLSVARQVDKHYLQAFLITECLKLLLPCVHVTAKAVNKTEGFGIRACRLIPYFIMYANTIVDSNILRLQLTKRLRLLATIDQQQRE